MKRTNNETDGKSSNHSCLVAVLSWQGYLMLFTKYKNVEVPTYFYNFVLLKLNSNTLHQPNKQIKLTNYNYSTKKKVLGKFELSSTMMR